MATTKFYLKDPKEKNTPTLIYMFFNYDGKRLKYSTSEKIPPKYWNKDSVRKSYTGGSDINNQLAALQSKVLEIYRKYRLQGTIPSPSELRTDLNEAFSKTAKQKLTFFDVFEEFVESTKTKVHKRTTAKYETLKKHLKAFQKNARYNIKFENINITFYDKFMNFCLGELDLVNNSAGKYVTTLKTFLNWSVERKYTTNLDYKKFKVLKEEGDIVYLDFEELLHLFNFDFSDNQRLEKVRDAFCLSCFTGLRFSDIKQLKQENIKGDFIKIKSYKTKETLRIPLNEYAKEIINKYIDHDQFLQVISNQKMNLYLKELAEIAEIDTPVTLTKIKGVERIETTQPKYDLISTHTGRRTFVTVSLEKGMRPEIVMKITGHKSYDVFKKYIQITDKVKDIEMKKVWGQKKTPKLRVS